MIKVVKFGGSSVANAAQFRKVKKIVEADPARQFIVTSACGKESRDDHKVTDLLYLCQAHVTYGVSYQPLLDEIQAKFQRIVTALHLKTDIQGEFAKIGALMGKDMSLDYLVSRGEYLTGLCLAEYLGAQFVDAVDVIAFRYDGSIDMEKTSGLIRQHSMAGRRMLVPGFYGAMPDGSIKVMSRGGSDITGAVIANAVDADIYENWTDISGFMVVDPKIVKDPLPIRYITYDELRKISYMGASVLHDDAIFPCKGKNIPINIRNTNEPDNPGTMIMADCTAQDRADPPHFITGITGRKDFTVITVTKSHISSEVGFLRKALTVFENYRVSIESVPVSVDSFSVIVASAQVAKCLYEVVGDINEQLHPDDVTVHEHLALVAVVGRGMKERPGMSGKLFAEFGRNRINIKTIDQGADELSIMVGVENRDFEKAIRCIYDRFIKEEQHI